MRGFTNKRTITTMLFLVVFFCVGQVAGFPKYWSTYLCPDGGIMYLPVDNGVYLCGSVVNCYCIRAQDWDWWDEIYGCNEGTDWDTMAYDFPEWTVTHGEWVDGDNTGMYVYWLAPDSPESGITFKIWDDDLPESVVPPDTGSRDDIAYGGYGFLQDTHSGIKTIIPDVNSVTYGAQSGAHHLIYDTKVPQYSRSSSRNDPAAWTKGSDATATVKFWASETLSQGVDNIIVRADTSGDSDNIGNWGDSSNITFYTSWPTPAPGILCVSESNINDSVQRKDYSATWKYKCTDGSNNWINSTTQYGTRLFVVYDAPECTSSGYTKANIRDAIDEASGESTESAIASKANENVGDNLYTGCICGDCSWNQTNFDAAMDEYPPSPPKGMCCCRAEGLDCVLNVLGIGPYTNIYCNEMPEGEWATSKHQCAGSCTTHGPVLRAFRASGIWNKWQGAVRSGGTGTTAYAPVGNYEDDHDGIADSWTYRWHYGNGASDYCTGACTITGTGGCSAHSSYWDRFED